MRKDRHVLDVLSAYLDGEAEDPEAISRHLQRCATCARRHTELSKTSAWVRSLPETEATPEFTSRVMARIREAEPKRPVFWNRSGLLPAAAVALVLLFAGARILFREAPLDNAFTPNGNVQSTQRVINTTALVEELERRIIEANDVVFDEGLLFTNGVGYSDQEVEGAADVLLSGDWSMYPESFFNVPGEFELLLMNLDEAENAALREELVNYVQGGQPT